MEDALVRAILFVGLAYLIRPLLYWALGIKR